MIHSLIAAACIFIMLMPSAASARWSEARSPNFIVYSDGGVDDLRQSVALLEDYDRLLRTLTGTTAPPSKSPLKVYLVNSTAKLRQVSDLPSGALGFYSARVGGTAAFAVRGDRPGLGGEEVLLHEYAHHFATRYYPAYYPGWYSEGFAEYVMTARFLPDRIEVGRYNPARAVALLRGSWIPIDRILSTSRDGMPAAQLPQFYAESWLIVHYIFASPERQQALTRYLGDLHRGVDEPRAFQAAFGEDHRAFEAALKRYMNGSIAFGSVGRVAGAAPVITIKALPESADDLLLRHAALTLGIADPKRETETITAIRTTAARFPDDPYAQRLLARAEIGSGDRAAGVAIVERLIAASPTDAELLYYRGLADFFTGRKDPAQRAERLAAARPWFARAVQADAGYYTAVYRLALCAPLQADAPSDETIGQLMRAHELAPLVGDIAIDAATALLARGRYAEAEAAILPIATNPHGGNVARASALLTNIRQAAAR